MGVPSRRDILQLQFVLVDEKFSRETTVPTYRVTAKARACCCNPGTYPSLLYLLKYLSKFVMEVNVVLTKVFCLGFHKTGTKSFAAALSVLGYRVTGPNGVKDPEIATNVREMARSLLSGFDAFQDNPWPILYKEVDSWCPGSKFVLLERDPDAWIRSQVNYFGDKETPMRRWIYGAGAPLGNERLYLKRYNEHNSHVRDYFASRPNDLLIMNFSRGDGWNRLCQFLGHKEPSDPFPHANKGNYQR
jgi:hypothetical protein